MPYRRAQCLGYSSHGRPIHALVPVRRRRTTARRRFNPRRGSRIYRVPRRVRSIRGEHEVHKLRFAINDGNMWQLTSTSGALATPKVYRANDVYDPYFTGAGSQPRGFDQIMPRFRHFMVLGSKIVTIWSYGVGSSTSNSMSCAITLKDGTTAIADSKDLIEHPRTRVKTISAETDSCTVVGKYSWRINGLSSPLDDNTLWGTVAASPTSQYYFHLNAFSPNGGTEDAWVTGYIDYTVVFFQAIEPAAS